MMDRLLEICALDGTSGDEGAVRDYIKSSIHADKVITDNLGNLLVFKKGRKNPEKPHYVRGAHGRGRFHGD